MIRKILIVDDSSTARMFIRRCLEISGFMDAEFTEAPDGRQALALVGQNPADLIVADVNMPVLDGRNMLRQLKSDPATSAIPVVFITSTSNEAANAALLSDGAYAVMSKPITPPIMISALGGLLKDQGDGHGAA